MQILRNFKVGIEEYNERGKNNCFLVFARSPACHCIFHRRGPWFDPSTAHTIRTLDA